MDRHKYGNLLQFTQHLSAHVLRMILKAKKKKKPYQKQSQDMFLVCSIHSQDGEQDGSQSKSDTEEHTLSPILKYSRINEVTIK